MDFLDDYNRLCQRAPALWSLSRPVRVLGARFGRRMIVCGLADGALALLSPAPVTPDQCSRLCGLGTVGWLIVPTDFHDTKLNEVVSQFSGAALITSAGLASRFPGRSLNEPLPGALAAVLEPFPIAGMPRVNETVFLHRPSGWLLVSDLVFNFDQRWTGWDRMVLRLAGAHGGPRVSRFFRASIRDRAAFQRSVSALPWERIIGILPSHGELIQDRLNEVRAMLDAL